MIYRCIVLFLTACSAHWEAKGLANDALKEAADIALDVDACTDSVPTSTDLGACDALATAYRELRTAHQELRKAIAKAEAPGAGPADEATVRGAQARLERALRAARAAASKVAP